jgi:[acyl-carrier-protein] S-malonyltransferase
MKRTAVVVAPGRGTYNKTELGYLARHQGDRAEPVGSFDDYRRAQGQVTVSDLDGAAHFSAAIHTRGDNASSLIYACAQCDFAAIDRSAYDIVAVTGNSMGWYIALACAGALTPVDGLKVVNTTSTLMQESLTGGQVIYPFMDENWRPLPNTLDRILSKMAEIDARPDHLLCLSIDLGGMIVLAGNAKGLDAFESEMPATQGRFPLRLQGHAGFHTPLQEPVAKEARARLPRSMFGQPDIPLIDGRGAIWQPHGSDTDALWSYTLNHQIVAPYDFTAAIRTAAREFMPDVFIVLGPGTTMGGAVAQSLILADWRGLRDKASFQDAQNTAQRLISMGMESQRAQVVAP